jgi:NitT/TauT family transport system substrate-binding protein
MLNVEFQALSMKKNIVFNCSIVLLMCFVMFSCTKKTDKTIKIGILEGPSIVSFMQMIDQPQMIGGMKTEIIIKSEPMQIQAMMMRGELDFAILPTVMAANLYNKGLEYKMLGCPIWGTLYLLTNDKLLDVNTLKGQTIHVFGQASTSDILLQRLIKQKEISDVKIDYTYSTNSEIAQALIHKKIKLAVVSEPMVSNLLWRDKSIKIVAKIECEGFVKKIEKDIFVQTAFMVSNRFSDKYPTLVEQVSKAYSSSCNFANDQPNLVAQLLVSRNFSSNINVAKHSISLCSIHYMEASYIEKELNQYLHIFYDFDPKSIGGKMPESSFIYQTY